MTEPGAGSDVAAMSTTYRRDGDAFVLNGTKHFISNGSMADWIVTFATSDKRAQAQGHLVLRVSVEPCRASRASGCTASSASAPPIPARSSTTTCGFPPSALVGREGEGFKYAMATFDRSRPEIGAIAIGVAQRALDECLKYSQQRSAFGAADREFPGDSVHDGGHGGRVSRRCAC